MKSAPAFLILTCVTALQAAVSPILLPTGGAHYTNTAAPNFPGAPGNFVFDGSHFVTLGSLPDGVLRLTWFDTNAVIVSKTTLPLTGSTPRIALHGTNLLIAWLNTNTAPALLQAAPFSNGVLGQALPVASNVAHGRVAISGAKPPFLVVWQNDAEHSVIRARFLDANAATLADEFPVSHSAAPQKFPSADSDGTNHLVCWMQHHPEGNDWRVMARLVAHGLPTGQVLTVSQTNSLFAHETACSFGSNYLTVWSVGNVETWYNYFSNVLGAVIDGRTVSREGTLLGDSFAILRQAGANTNVVVSYTAGSYLVAAVNGMHLQPTTQGMGYDGLGFWTPLLTPVQANGSNSPAPISPPSGIASQRRVAGGADCFLVVDCSSNGVRTVALARESELEPRLEDVIYRNGSLSVQVSSAATNVIAVEYTTNLLDWRIIALTELPRLTNYPRLFVRAKQSRWHCIETLRSMNAVQERWALENKRNNTDYGSQYRLHANPSCPAGGTYSWQGTVQCSIPGHKVVFPRYH
jgi:hypothetical protein